LCVHYATSCPFSVTVLNRKSNAGRDHHKKYAPNYSAILGAFITSGISYTYYPASDRNASLLVQTALLRIAEGSVAGIFQEFVVRKLTPHLKKDPPPQP